MNSPAPKKKPRFSDEMVQGCLRALDAADAEDLFELIPRIGVLRDPRFIEPLLKLLSGRDIKKREFAAYALGAMGSRDFLEPLEKAFDEARSMSTFGSEELLVAVIEAIGSLGDDTAVEFFLPILKNAQESGRSGRKMARRIVESLGAIAQQGGARSVEALVELTHQEPELSAQALSELSVAFWHRPNEISDAALERIHQLTRDRHPVIAESALSALQSLADVGCQRAERLFASKSKR